MYDFSLIDMITYIHFKVFFFNIIPNWILFALFQWFSLHLLRNRYRHLYVLRRYHYPLLDIKYVCSNNVLYSVASIFVAGCFMQLYFQLWGSFIMIVLCLERYYILTVGPITTLYKKKKKYKSSENRLFFLTVLW